MRFIYWRAKSIGTCLFLAYFVIGKKKMSPAEMTFSSPSGKQKLSPILSILEIGGISLMVNKIMSLPLTEELPGCIVRLILVYQR